MDTKGQKMNPTKEQMEALALWWTSAIYGTPIRSNGDTSLQGIMASALQTDLAMTEISHSNKEVFYQTLLKGIMAKPFDKLKVDYHPQGAALVAAAEEAKLSDFALPPKIYSWWNNELNQYKGANGYQSEIEVIA